MESFEISAEIEAQPKTLYKAWLSSDEHSAFTGGAAQIDPTLNGEFSAWDGYITGTTVTLEPHSRIVQKWRTTEFADDDPDSTLEVLFEKRGDKTRLTLKHTDIPDGQGDSYKQGWDEHYFQPMKEYFSG